MFSAMFLIAASPIILLIVLLLLARWPLVKAAPLTFVFAAGLAAIKLDLPASHLVAAIAKGLLLSLDVMLIVFGAVFFLNDLRGRGVVLAMQEQLAALTADRHLQALLLAWLFGGFIEGVSGFGTPAVIVAPLLVGIGFQPLTAILVSLLANSTAVAFGAVGTPVRIGFAGLDITGVAERAALINLFAGLLVPLMIVYMVGGWSSLKRYFFWAIFAGLAFLVPYVGFAFLGYEFPSIFGGALGLAAMVATLRFRAIQPVHLGELARPFAAYALLLALLLLGKLVFSAVQYRLELGGNLSHTIQFFNPGFAFLTVIALLALYHRTPFTALVTLARTTAAPLGKTALSLVSIGSLTYLMIVSGMTTSLAQAVVTPALPYYSAIIGAFGSFLAGSATVSNLLFAQMQLSAAETLSLAAPLILALQLVGAGAGNMIALPNILAVQASVGEDGQEALILRRLILPCALYLLAVALVVHFTASGYRPQM